MGLTRRTIVWNINRHSPDVITAFAVPGLSGCSEPLIFSGLVAVKVSSSGWSLSLLWTGCD